MVRQLEAARVLRVGLVGNPNTGKSTLFNRLTGLRQRIANYPGITVEERSGTVVGSSRTFELVDLPGTYSLSAASADERVVLDALSGRDGRRHFDLLICVLDATNLERNLLLPLQLADFGIPVVLVLNQWDGLRKRKWMIDTKLLSERLGVPVVPFVARTGEGEDDLYKAIDQALESSSKLTPTEWPGELEEGVAKLREELPELTRTEAIRLIFDGGRSHSNLWPGHEEALQRIVDETRAGLMRIGKNPGPAEAVIQYHRIQQIMDGVFVREDAPHPGSSESIDRLLLHRFWGTAIFIAIMWVVFQAVYSWAGPAMDIIEGTFGAVGDALRGPLSGMPVLESLVVDGLVAGVGGVLVFLPQIFILFFFISLLEETGYMARAAFLMDKALGWCGLNGKSFVPLLSSYACAIPGILAARTLENRWARATTILMAPFMSCSARLPVYVLLIGAFIEPAYGTVAAGWTLFAMHFVGLLVAAPLAWVAHKLLRAQRAAPFILEMPEYKVPHFRNLTIRMWESGREFLVRAGTIILAFSVIIWALLYFPRDEAMAAQTKEAFQQEVASERGIDTAEASRLIETDEHLTALEEHRIEGAYIEDSYLGRFGKFVQPIFAPAGFDWKITVGVLSSFPAREVIIATFGIIYRLGPEVDEESPSLRERLAKETWSAGPKAGQPIFTLPVVVAVMVFFALCLQCGATVAVIAKELNALTAAASFLGMTVLAWLGAVVTYQLGTWIGL